MPGASGGAEISHVACCAQILNRGRFELIPSHVAGKHAGNGIAGKSFCSYPSDPVRRLPNESGRHDCRLKYYRQRAAALSHGPEINRCVSKLAKEIARRHSFSLPRRWSGCTLLLRRASLLILHITVGRLNKPWTQSIKLILNCVWHAMCWKTPRKP